MILALTDGINLLNKRLPIQVYLVPEQLLQQPYVRFL